MRKNYLPMLIGCCLSIASDSYGMRRTWQYSSAIARSSGFEMCLINGDMRRLERAIDWEIPRFWGQDQLSFHQNHFWMVIGEAYSHSARFPGPNWICVDPRADTILIKNPYHESLNDTIRIHLKIRSYFASIYLPPLEKKVSYIVDDIGGMGHLDKLNNQPVPTNAMWDELRNAWDLLVTDGMLVTTPAVLTILSKERRLDDVRKLFEIMYRRKLKLDFAKPGLARDYYVDSKGGICATCWQSNYQYWQPPLKEDLTRINGKKFGKFIKMGKREYATDYWLSRGDKIPSGDDLIKPLVFFVKK